MFEPSSFQIPVHPTTGLLAVFVALNYCDVVHLAGFGYPKTANQRQPIHYYRNDTMSSMKVCVGRRVWCLLCDCFDANVVRCLWSLQNSYHDVNHEARALRRLEDSGAIFYLHAHS